VILVGCQPATPGAGGRQAGPARLFRSVSDPRAALGWRLGRAGL